MQFSNTDLKIRKLQVRNFKRFELLEIDLSSFDCLVGANNSGKSTLLQSLALFDFVLHNCLARRTGNGFNGQKNQLEIKNRSIPPEEFVVLPVANAIDLWTDKIAQKTGKHVIVEVGVEFVNGRAAKATLDLNFNRYSIGLQTDNDPAWLEQLAAFKISYLPVFSTFLTQEEKRTQAVVEDALSRGRVNSVIRNLLYDLKQKGEINYLEEVLQNAVPSFQKLNIDFDEVTDKYIDVSYREEGKRKAFDLFMAGSGFQQFVYLFGFIRLRNPNLVLLDEPDVHLHGTMQAALIDELKKLINNEGKQILFATHSRDIISRLEPDQIISLNGNTANRLQINFDVYDLLETLGSFDNIQIAQLQEFRRMIVVEDQDDWKFLQVFGKKILGAANWQKVERRLAIYPAKGNPCRQDMKKLRKQLTSLFKLNLTGSPLKFFVIADWDYHPFREKLLQKLSEIDPNIEYHIWKRAEIENYMLVPSAIERIVKDKNGIETLSNGPLIDSYHVAIEESKEIVEEKVAKAIEDYSNVEKKGWDIVRKNRAAKKMMNEIWEADKPALADAKAYVLPKIKRWLQESKYAQFSDLALAESIYRDEIDPEIVNVIRRVALFAGVEN